MQLAGRGFDFSLGRDRARLAARPVRDLATEAAVTARADERPSAVRARLAGSGWRQAFVTDAAERLVGIYTQDERDEATVGEIVHAPDLVFDDRTSVAQAMERLRGFVGDAVPIVERDGGRYLGAVSEAAIVSAWLDEADGLRREENASL
ncbi:MAG: CBS domain-containing protein [Deinococcus-Thermus bacterium]|nr:CBS domain-containing protein [Deinococcota bacterium]